MGKRPYQDQEPKAPHPSPGLRDGKDGYEQERWDDDVDAGIAYINRLPRRCCEPFHLREESLLQGLASSGGTKEVHFDEETVVAATGTVAFEIALPHASQVESSKDEASPTKTCAKDRCKQGSKG